MLFAGILLEINMLAANQTFARDESRILFSNPKPPKPNIDLPIKDLEAYSEVQFHLQVDIQA
jgi:hypothetical protein